MKLINFAAETQNDRLENLRAGVRRFDAEHSLGVFDALNVLLTLKRTAADLESHLDSGCKPLDLSTGRLNVLMALNVAPDKTMALSEIGKYLVVTRPNITGLIDGLVRDGFVRRVDHPEDRRIVLAQLTERAQEFLQRFVPQHIGVIKTIAACFSLAEQRNLAAMLDKLRSHIRTLNPPKYEM